MIFMLQLHSSGAFFLESSTWSRYVQQRILLPSHEKLDLASKRNIFQEKEQEQVIKCARGTITDARYPHYSSSPCPCELQSEFRSYYLNLQSMPEILKTDVIAYVDWIFEIRSAIRSADPSKVGHITISTDYSPNVYLYLHRNVYITMERMESRTPKHKQKR